MGRAGQAEARQPRSRLLSWLSGEYVEEPARHEPGVLSPPDADVRREMLRLELEARVASLKAENDALTAAAMTDAPAGPSTPDAEYAPDAANARAIATVPGAADAPDGEDDSPV